MDHTPDRDLSLYHPAGLMNPANALSAEEDEFDSQPAVTFLVEEDEAEEGSGEDEREEDETDGVWPPPDPDFTHPPKLRAPKPPKPEPPDDRSKVMVAGRTLIPTNFETNPLYDGKTRKILRRIAGPALEKRKERNQRQREREMDRISNAFLETLGSTQEFKTALALSESPNAKKLLTAILTPKYRKWTITSLARVNGFTPATMFNLWRDYNVARGMLVLASGIPAVSAGVVEDAKSIEVCCPRCDGWGQIERGNGDGTERAECPGCKGKGSVRKAGDSDSRKLMFEAAGIIKGQKGINVNINQVGVSSVLDELDSMGPIIDVSPKRDGKDVSE